MPRRLCLASLTASSADGCAPSCASRKSAPASDDARPTITAGPMPFSRLTAYSPFARPMSKRDTPDEETNDWRAVCGRTGRTVRRAGRAQPFPTPIEGRRVDGGSIRLLPQSRSLFLQRQRVLGRDRDGAAAVGADERRGCLASEGFDARDLGVVERRHARLARQCRLDIGRQFAPFFHLAHLVAL